MNIPSQKPIGLQTSLRGRWQHKEVSNPQWEARHYIGATIASVLFWLLLRETSGTTFANLLGAVVIGGVVLLPPFLLARRQLVAGLTVLAYLAAIQPAIRTYVPDLRYNILEYTLPLTVFLILTQRRTLILSIPTFFYLLYLGLELIGIINAERLDIVRGVFFASFTLFLILLVADQIKLPLEHMNYLWRGYLVGALSILALLARILFSNAAITWTTASNLEISAGMGPNQVSFLLSIAVFLCLVLADRATLQGRWLYRLMAGVLAYFMILTFSRGGLYIVVGAILLYYLLLQQPSRKTLPVLAGFGVLLYAVLTIASDTTQGIVLARYSELDTSNRLLLAQQGWQIFLDNPIWGVGTANYHVTVAADEYFGSLSGAHNEVIRAAAEHGIFGLIFWSLFAVSAVGSVLRASKGQTRTLRLTFLFIAFLSLFYNGLKLVIQPLLLLMAFTLVDQKPSLTGSILDQHGRSSLQASSLSARLRASHALAQKKSR